MSIFTDTMEIAKEDGSAMSKQDTNWEDVAREQEVLINKYWKALSDIDSEVTHRGERANRGTIKGWTQDAMSSGKPYALPKRILKENK